MDGVAVVDGVVVPLAEAKVPATGVALDAGLAVFEVLEAGGGRDPGPNLERLRRSAAACGVPVPDEAVLRREIALVAEALGGRCWVSIDLTGDKDGWASGMKAPAMPALTSTPRTSAMTASPGSPPVRRRAG